MHDVHGAVATEYPTAGRDEEPCQKQWGTWLVDSEYMYMHVCR